MNDDIKRIERLAKKNREKSIGKKTSELLDKPSARKYIPPADEKRKTDDKYEGADRLFDEMRRKPHYD